MKKSITEIPSWLRLRYVFGPKVRSAFLTIAVLGTVIRLDNVIKYEWTHLAGLNHLIKFLSFGYWYISSLELLYLSSCFYLVGYFLLVWKIPRDVEVTLGKADYIKRSLFHLNSTNIVDWFSNYSEQLKTDQVVIERNIVTKFETYRSYCEATERSGKAVKLDNDLSDIIIMLLQARYDFANRLDKPNWRFAIAFLTFLSATISGLVLIDTVVLTIKSII